MSGDGWWTRNNAIVTVLLVQAVGALIWGARMGAEVDQLRASQADQDKRIDRIDENGTRRLSIVEDRQLGAMQEVADQRMRLERLDNALRELDRRIPQPTP